MEQKNFYQILGVAEGAEDIVIRAAYRALAQKYHPDKWTGDKGFATARMAEINEAYDTLSDPEKRTLYDRQQSSEFSEDGAGDEDESLVRAVDETWTEVLDYFPALDESAASLGRLSRQLEFAFKVMLIESKKFNEAAAIAIALERSYLQRYFGTNVKILGFAKSLILAKKREAARDLNKAVNLLGSGVDPDVIIKKIKEKHQAYVRPAYRGGRTKDEAELLLAAANTVLLRPSLSNALKFLKMNGQTAGIYSEGWFSSKYQVEINGKQLVMSESELIGLAQDLAGKVYA